MTATISADISPTNILVLTVFKISTNGNFSMLTAFNGRAVDQFSVASFTTNITSTGIGTNLTFFTNITSSPIPFPTLSGAAPQGALVQRKYNGVIYGTTESGTAFEISTNLTFGSNTVSYLLTNITSSGIGTNLTFSTNVTSSSNTESYYVSSGTLKTVCRFDGSSPSGGGAGCMSGAAT